MRINVWPHVLYGLLAVFALIAVCGVCMGEPKITLTGIRSATMTEYPNENFQTLFSLDGNGDGARATMYMLNAPTSGASFTKEAERYISSVLGNEFSDTLGRQFDGHRVTYAEVVGAYDNEILVMSRKIGDKQASFNKYEPTFGQYDPKKYGVETLPSEIAQRLQPKGNFVGGGDFDGGINLEWEMESMFSMTGENYQMSFASAGKKFLA